MSNVINVCEWIQQPQKKCVGCMGYCQCELFTSRPHCTWYGMHFGWLIFKSPKFSTRTLIILCESRNCNGISNPKLSFCVLLVGLVAKAFDLPYRFMLCANEPRSIIPHCFISVLVAESVFSHVTQETHTNGMTTMETFSTRQQISHSPLLTQ